jgi:hypothetical protein
MPTLRRSESEAPKHSEIVGRAIRRTSHGEAFIPYAKFLAIQSRLAELYKAHRP